MTAHPMPAQGAQEAEASPLEREHLERAHDEICTALTVLRSNVDLVRAELAREADGEAHPAVDPAVERHLRELDMALDRLRGLARQMRVWHGPGPVGAPVAKGTLRGASVLP